MSGEGSALCRTGADQKMHEMQEEQLLALHFPSGNVHCLLLPGRSVANQLKIKKNENKNDKKKTGNWATCIASCCQGGSQRSVAKQLKDPLNSDSN